MLIVIVAAAGLLLAYANGANDNFKGVATLFGCGSSAYRGALLWATVTTLLGSLAAVALAGTLLKAFSGKGLVDGALVASPTYTASVALGAALTVLAATRVGMPVSTTHALIGALLGAALAARSSINGQELLGTFVTPMLLSPVLAVAITAGAYPVLKRARAACGVTSETCLCVDGRRLEAAPSGGAAVALQRAEQLSLRVGDRVECRQHYSGELVGVEASTVLDIGHYASAGAVSFARGLNDTPKIAALLLTAPSVGPAGAAALVGCVIALGGLLNARRVAETMSRRITPMNPGQGFTANVVTSLVVIGASRIGLPVSTTHVSCGALFGIGAATGQARWGTVATILLAWVTTAPTAAALGAASFLVASSLGA